jgi:hypothetical protein
LRRTAVLAASASRRSAASGFPPASSFSAALSFAPHRRTSSIVPGSSLTTKHRITDFPKIGTPFGDLRFSGKQVDSQLQLQIGENRPKPPNHRFPALPPNRPKPPIPSFSSKSPEATESPIPVNRTALRRSAIYRQQVDSQLCHQIGQNHRFRAFS